MAMKSLAEIVETEGFSASQRLFSEAKAHELYLNFFDEVGLDPGGTENTDKPTFGWHHSKEWVWKMATDPALVASAQEILGCVDVVLFGTSFWYKPALDGKRVPWHQDGPAWNIDPCVAVTAWISLGYATPENGGVKVLPKSHHRRWNHERKEGLTYKFLEEIPANEVDQEKVVCPVLNPGELFWFNERMVHGSDPNTSNIPRLGFSVRFCPSNVKFLSEICEIRNSTIQTYLLGGVDRAAEANSANRMNPPF
jgi:ectoine hydroxylase-related dioxygenase (phytanoyl-CoA dioxygenase family)